MSNDPPAWRPPGVSPPPPPLPQGPPLGVPSAPPIGFGHPQGYAPAGFGVPPGFPPGRPPRPDTKVAAWLMITGAIVIAVGCFLPWVTFGGDGSVNGFDDVTGPFDDEAATGIVFMFFAAVMLAFGITTIAAKRLLAIMIIGIVVAAFSMLGAIAEYSDYDDAFSGDMGAGLPVVALGSALALAGAITGCSTRRRWR